MSDDPKPITALSDVSPDPEPVEAPKPKRRRRSRDDDYAEEQEKLTDEEINAPGRQWYFVHTYSGHENKVRHSIKLTVEQRDATDRVFHVLVPTEEEIEIRDGQKRTVKKKLYPGYVLVQTIELVPGEPRADEVWHWIKDTTGVTGFVSMDTGQAGQTPHPVPLTKDEVQNILRTLRKEEPRVRVGFKVGENVRIIDGPFEDFVGTVEDINLEKGKVRALVNMFGRETPVELDFLQVEKM